MQHANGKTILNETGKYTYGMFPIEEITHDYNFIVNHKLHLDKAVPEDYVRVFLSNTKPKGLHPNTFHTDK